MPQSRRTSNRRKSAQNKKIARIAKKVLYKNTETKIKMIHFNDTQITNISNGSFYDIFHLRFLWPECVCVEVREEEVVLLPRTAQFRLPFSFGKRKVCAESSLIPLQRR